MRCLTTHGSARVSLVRWIYRKCVEFSESVLNLLQTISIYLKPNRYQVVQLNLEAILYDPKYIAASIYKRIMWKSLNFTSIYRKLLTGTKWDVIKLRHVLFPRADRADCGKGYGLCTV
jgi:hypothetical protein